MNTHGPADESLRLAEHYRQMTDEELIVLAQHPSELTEMAQTALSQESCGDSRAESAALAS